MSDEPNTITCISCGHVYKLGRDPYSHSEDRILPIAKVTNKTTGIFVVTWECTACNNLFDVEDSPNHMQPYVHNIRPARLRT